MTQSGMTHRTHDSPVKNLSGPAESPLVGLVEAYDERGGNK